MARRRAEGKLGVRGPMDALTLQDRIERIAVILRAELRALASLHELKLVQVEALRYLAEANRFSDNPAAVAEALGLTPGTVSQTLRTLVKKGLVSKQADETDGRLVHCALTQAGMDLVDQSGPSVLLGAALPAWNKEEIDALARGLDRMLRGIQESNGLRTFGVCHTCRHFSMESEKAFRCRFFKERLVPAEMMLRCREHEPKSEPLD